MSGRIRSEDATKRREERREGGISWVCGRGEEDGGLDRKVKERMRIEEDHGGEGYGRGGQRERGGE